MVKQFLLPILILWGLFPAQMFAQSQDGIPGKDKITIMEAAHDFGNIVQGKIVFHVFQAVNISSTALTLDNVEASCGCTTPEWSRDPIAPGATFVIRVGYNATAVGYFEKTITILYGGGMTSMLSIKGTVWKTPEQPAPFNKSIAFLKTAKF